MGRCGITLTDTPRRVVVAEKRSGTLGGRLSVVAVRGEAGGWSASLPGSSRRLVVAERGTPLQKSNFEYFENMNILKKMLALPCPRPRPDALPEPGGSGRTWGGAGLGNLAPLIPVLRPHILTYAWG